MSDEALVNQHEVMINDIFQKWENTNLLNGIDENRKLNIALCLESQRRLNEKTNVDPQFKRISVPVVRRVLPNVKPNFTSELSETKNVHVFKTKWDMVAFKDIQFQYALDQEVEATAIISHELTNEINEMFGDISNATVNFGGFALNGQDLVMLYN